MPSVSSTGVFKSENAIKSGHASAVVYRLWCTCNDFRPVQPGQSQDPGSHSPQAQTVAPPPLWQALFVCTEPCTQTHPTTLVNFSPTRTHSSARYARFLLLLWHKCLHCLVENNLHMCYVWSHKLAQMHQILMTRQINPCTLPAAGQFWLHLWCRNRWLQCCLHAQPGGVDCFWTCPSSWCAGISGDQVPPLPIKTGVLTLLCILLLPPSMWSFVLALLCCFVSPFWSHQS